MHKGKAMLEATVEGNEIISHYKEKKCLNPKLRKRIVQIILTDTFSKQMLLPRPVLDDIAKQICKIFQKEMKVDIMSIFSQKIQILVTCA